MSFIPALISQFTSESQSRLLPKHNRIVRSYSDKREELADKREELVEVLEISMRRGGPFKIDAADWVNLSSTPICYGGLGYAKASRLSKCIHTGGVVHRIVMAGVLGGVDAFWRNGKRLTVDHINGDPMDNRRVNLRLCDHHGNMRSQSKVSGASRFKGVMASPTKGKWVAAIRVTTDRKGRNIHLGTFTDEEQAARAYDAKALELFGVFARTNEDLGLYPDALPGA